MTDERKELIEMVSSMTDEQFTRFLEMAIQDPDFSRKNTPIVFSGFVWFSRLCHGFAGVLSSRFLGVRSGFNG